MRRTHRLLAAVLLSCVLWSIALAQQPTPMMPARILLSAPPSVQGTIGKLTVTLADTKGRPVAATSDMALRVSATGAKSDQDTVVIRKDQTSANFSISKDEPGVAEVRVEQTGAPTQGFAAAADIGFSPDLNSYKPLPPYKLWLTANATKLRAGIDAVNLVIRYVDRNKTPLPAPRAYDISFPEESDKIAPHPLRIRAGDPYGSARLSASEPGIVNLNPVVSPPTALENDANRVEFVSPIVGLRLIADPPQPRGVFRPTVAIKVGLLDGDKNWIASDKERTVVLQLDPPTGGRLGKVELTIPKNQSVATTSFTPLQEGKVAIKAIVGEGLIVEPAEVEFRYATLYFLLMAMIGGACGGCVKQVATGERTWRKILGASVLGALTGVLFYFLAPLLVTVTLTPATLQNVSKVVEAFAWGFIGGVSGVGILVWAFTMRPKGGAQAAGGARP